MKILNKLKGTKSVSRLKLAAVALLGATLAGSLISGVATLPANAMVTTTATTKVNSGADIYSATTGFSKTAIADLLSKMTSKTTYADALAYLDSQTNATIDSSEIATLNSGNDLIVHFGGFDWTVTYLSKDMNGNMIATLWYADTEEIAVYNDFYSASTTGGYAGYKYSNHYGASKIRSIALGNGGDYYYASSNTVTDDDISTKTPEDSEVQASKFYKFAQGELSGYLVAPNFVSWQKSESSELTGNRLLNESLCILTDNWYSDKINNSQTDPLYFQWGADKIWLPSIAEVGNVPGGAYDVSTSGIWNISTNQRASASTGGYSTNSWSRSGRDTGSNTVYSITELGAANALFPTRSLGVRPAIHLNLTKALGDDANDTTILQNVWNAAVQESITTGKQVNFTLPYSWYAQAEINYTTSFGEGIGFKYGALYVPAGADIVFDLNGYILDRNLYSGVDNGYVICNEGTLTINDSSENATGILTGGYSLQDIGGCFYNLGTATVNGGNFINNRAAGGRGAAIYSFKKITINGGVFAYNSASTTGAVAVEGAGEINGGVYKNNTAQNGGGIYAAANATLTVNGGEIYNNTTTTAGGGIYASTDTTLIINNVEIYNNNAGQGGGIYASTGTTLIINDVEIYGNTATGGGGIYFNGAILEINSGKIYNNTGVSYGGGIDIIKGDVVFNYTIISGNTSERGGGIYVNAGTTEFNGGEISANTGSVRGGGVYIFSGAEFILNGGNITNNSAGDYGGGVYCNGSNDSGISTFTMNGGTISGNTLTGSTSYGAGVEFITGGVFNLSGGVIINNTTAAGAKNNVYINTTSGRITITGVLKNTCIGITPASTTASVVFTTGYTTAGNSTTNGSVYFFSDAEKTISSSSGELQVTTTTATTRTTLTWNVNNTAVSSLFYTVPYTGTAYNISTSVAVTGVDESGNAVSSPENPGIYYFTVASPASYSNPVFTLEITAQSLADAEVTVSAGAVYNGLEQTPNVNVVVGGVTLVQDKDYSVSYSNNINAGNATVAVTGIGNYNGTVIGHFTIEKRNLEIRWGDATVEYNGETQAIKAVAEGLLSGESISIVLYYTINGEFVTPVNAGEYLVYANLNGGSNYQIAKNATSTYYFTIKPKAVDAIWSEDSFVYNGSNQAPTAYYTDLDGNKVDLDVNVSGSHADVDTYSATAAFKTDDDASANYALKSATFNYSIEKAGAKLAWGSDSHEFDGSQYAPTFTIEGVNGEDLSSGVSVTYWLDGVSLGTDAPVNVGKYIARATFADSNYVLVDSNGKVIEYSEFEFSITAAAAPITWDTFSATYDGNGQAPTFSFDSGSYEVDYTITYKLSGDKEYSEDKPVDAGNYIAKVEFENGNYVEVEHSFTIAKKDVAVAWSGGENYYVSGNPVVYNYLYDGAAHAPAATAKVTVNGDEITLEVTVAGQITVAAYTATAVLDDNDTNKNFNLTGATHSFNIVKSNVTDIEWFEYGSASPVEDVANTKLAFLQTAVYGLTGPKLTAYGIATVNMPVEGGMQVEITARVPLAVSYSSTSIGYWDFGDYTATAAVANGQSNNYAIASTAKNTTVSFEITDKLLEVVTAEVKWNYGDAEQDSETGIYYWIYDGNPHAPEAKLYIDGVETKTLAIGGRMTDAGKYYAFVLPNEYSIDEQYADCYFEIRPRGVEISWTGFGGSEDIFEWTYDGLPHAPVAAVKDSGGLICTLGAIKSYTDAGNYTANAVCLSSNFTITSGATQQFTIKRLTLDASKITWTSEGSKEDFVWVADGKDHAPAPSLTVTINGVDVDIAFTVVGATSVVGTHTAYATLSADTANANFILTGAEKSFIIETSTIQYIYWEGVNGSLTDFEWTYDGEEHFPKAYYWDDNSEKVYLNVIGGRTDAGEYIAYITDNTGLSANMTKAFSIVKQEISVDWSNSPASAVYDGLEHSPVASLVNGQGGKLVVGVDYTVTCFVTAGTYTAQVYLLNKNYVLADDVEGFKFTITPAQIAVVWHGNTTDGEFYWYYNEQDHAPTITYKAPAGVDVEIEVIGGDSYVGTYTAYAVCTNANFTLTNAEQTFEIKPYAITVTWVGNADNNDEFEWEYNGKEHKPDATYIDWNGDEKDLEVRGAQIDASTYTAVAVIPENCAFRYTDGVEGSGTHTFTITPKVITGVVWSKEKGGANSDEFEWEYDGEVKRPYARTLVDNLELTVTGSATDAGEYEAKAELPNENNYVFRSDVANTVKFTITPKEIEVIWYGKGGVKGDYTWNYTGEIIAPTANFEGVDNKTYDVPVSGGASAAGEHTAEAVNVFANYSFTELSSKQVFTINKEQLTVTWNGTAGADGNYTYTFNGKVQMPVASAKTSAGAAVNCSYTITDENDNEVGAVINAGTYKVSIVPANTNYVIAAEDATITVVITKLTVKVEWSTNTTLLYNGEEQAPAAWYYDADKQAIALDVTGMEKEVGTGYTATAVFSASDENSANYELDASTYTKKFEIVTNSGDGNEWVWTPTPGWSDDLASSDTDDSSGD